MIAGGYTLNGTKHNKNQDNFLVKENGEISIFMVADGMGGHAAGDVASALAIDVIENKLSSFDEQAIIDAISEANSLIMSKANTKEEYKGMGTTLAMCVVNGNEIFIVHIGDSRVYIDKGDGDVFVTKDHSFVQQMVDRGEISDTEAKKHKMKNVITRALGVEENAKVEIELTDLTEDTVIVICSDGVSNVMDDDEILSIAKKYEPKLAAETLCKKAKENGSTDDITAIVIINRGVEK
ncbi:MAG: protein phosphatase 2C domain-containing protein [Monoglobales bacterium]